MEKIEMNIDISILQKMPVLDKKEVILEIQPLAPLSMVSELPGSYYKTLKMPDKKMLCGLFENLLGWHIDLADRKQIFKELCELRKKQSKKGNGVEQVDYSKGSTYIPLLMDYFEIKDIQPVISKVMFYDDLWSKAYRRSDAAKTHIGGTTNVSYEILAQKNDVLQNGNEEKLDAFFKNNLGNFPLYYSTPTVREFIAMGGKYEIVITIDYELFKMLNDKILTDNLCYLGNSEGWVNLIFKEI